MRQEASSQTYDDHVSGMVELNEQKILQNNLQERLSPPVNVCLIAKRL